jgi:hypothetical protein
MTWDEEFSSRYDEWSVHMTADIAFYVDLASGRQRVGELHPVRPVMSVDLGCDPIPVSTNTTASRWAMT